MLNGKWKSIKIAVCEGESVKEIQSIEHYKSCTHRKDKDSLLCRPISFSISDSDVFFSPKHLFSFCTVEWVPFSMLYKTVCKTVAAFKLCCSSRKTRPTGVFWQKRKQIKCDCNNDENKLMQQTDFSILFHSAFAEEPPKTPYEPFCFHTRLS